MWGSEGRACAGRDVRGGSRPPCAPRAGGRWRPWRWRRHGAACAGLWWRSSSAGARARAPTRWARAAGVSLPASLFPCSPPSLPAARRAGQRRREGRRRRRRHPRGGGRLREEAGGRGGAVLQVSGVRRGLHKQLFPPSGPGLSGQRWASASFTCSQGPASAPAPEPHAEGLWRPSGVRVLHLVPCFLAGRRRGSSSLP